MFLYAVEMSIILLQVNLKSQRCFSYIYGKNMNENITKPCTFENHSSVNYWSIERTSEL